MKKFSFETQSYNFRDVVANNIIFHHTKQMDMHAQGT